jgi:hypothetical protein
LKLLKYKLSATIILFKESASLSNLFYLKIQETISTDSDLLNTSVFSYMFYWEQNKKLLPSMIIYYKYFSFLFMFCSEIVVIFYTCFSSLLFSKQPFFLVFSTAFTVRPVSTLQCHTPPPSILQRFTRATTLSKSSHRTTPSQPTVHILKSSPTEFHWSTLICTQTLPSKSPFSRMFSACRLF